MIDGSDTCPGGVERTGFSRGMNRDALTDPLGLFHGGGEFRFGVLVGGRKTSIQKRVLTGFINLDEIRPFFDLLADSVCEFGCAIR